MAELQVNVRTVPFMSDAEFPNPALAVVDLRSVVCCALCAVTCAACWAQRVHLANLPGNIVGPATQVSDR